MNESTIGLKLRAEDDDDLAILSACLFEALVPVAGLRFEGRHFGLALERFTWAEAEGDDNRLRQVPAVLVIDHVTRVQQTGFGPRSSGRFLSLSALAYDDGELLILFDEQAAIRLGVDRLSCRLEDTGPGRLPPIVPRHRSDVT